MDKDRIKDFAERVYRDMAGAMAIGMAYLGEKTGLFRALADGAAVSAAALAERTGLVPRYVEEWCAGMAAAGWLEHDEATGSFRLPAEHAFLLASERTDHFMGGLFLAGPSLLALAPRLVQAFREGGGIPPEAFDADWLLAVDLMNGGAYRERLASYWLAQLPEVRARLEAGGRALDVGCGVGEAAMALARAFPRAAILGVDPDGRAIGRARAAATGAGLANLAFLEGTIEAVPCEPPFDLVLLLDCLHDLAAPEATLAAIRARLAPEGVLFVMEPRAGDRIADNANPLGVTYYGFSLFHCTTQSLARGGPGLGTCAGPARITELLRRAGFAEVEPLTIKSFTNMFFAARG
ncbi:MAG: class I SAM-dependent methyltransferase [Geminicoccaceae bacterium]|nr:class I SAM-dependent methyltransferase [Geminicoccaceae bacterium]